MFPISPDCCLFHGLPPVKNTPWSSKTRLAPMCILIGACIIVILFLYVSLYIALLAPAEAVEGDIRGIARWRIPAYRAGGARAQTVFAPLNRIDRLVRPSYWAEEKIPDE